MHQTLDPILDQDLDAFLGIDGDLPKELFIVHWPAENKYGCFHYHEQGHNAQCLAAFKQEGGAATFAEWLPYSGLTIEKKPFDEVLDIAKSRPMPVVAAIVDCLKPDARIFYVR